ncbi:ATPase AAA [Ktedonobacter sp. SOSP1-85]|uniref:AAA domain-containing protein n=1 Tax=Ktedonobacter sp. SOSP1-85 TaxID=2778367 RepID=UPI001914E5FD|nr:AAA domain-containing protein [Ktedonobacter sp. SOSP1-85]GHO75861.1 ATPase AAA [Ktedonobacter sp. SOSP1-85]
MTQGTEQPEIHTHTPECFLCAFDPGPDCTGLQLEGRILATQERLVAGEQVAVFVLDTGSAHIELHLNDHYYRSLVRELRARWDVVKMRPLRLHVYHLPFAPTELTFRDRSRSCYRGNSYTLAVLEPDTLLNITDLNQAEYCQRQHLLQRLIPSPANAATIRGNIVHHCFKELLKEHDRGKFLLRKAGEEEKQAPETAYASLQRHLEQALQLHNIEMALAGINPEAMRQEVQPHLESLARWFEHERNTLWDMPTALQETHETQADTDIAPNQVRAETFLLAPEIGLRGRLDLFWQQAGRQRLLELKTGGAKGELPRKEHRWQVYGYHSLLMVRRDSQMKKALATLLYSGTPQHAQAFGIPASIREIQRVNERRNTLVLSLATGIPTTPPGPSRCNRCSLQSQCYQLSSLLDWQLPTIDAAFQNGQGEVSGPDTQDRRPWHFNTQEDKAFFAHYYHLLQLEGRAGEEQQARLWNTPIEERLKQGTAIQGLQALGPANIANDGWQQSFSCENTSELREGDEILLSSGDPIRGEVVSGTILQISSQAVTVWTRELIDHPALLDRYDNDLVHVRTLQNLMRWLQVDPHLRDLVAGKVRPRFKQQQVLPRTGFNAEQNLAVERALQMQDYLLVHGPPGTGKTSVIAEIVKRLTQQGQRVLLAAFTNQAVDNILLRLEREGFDTYLRLGHERSVAEGVRPHLLKGLVDESPHPEAVHDLLHSMPVIASTTATWSSDKYMPSHMLTSEDIARKQSGLDFDVAIIDEAGQLTVPAILGALRFAHRFILVGDEKQLPPLVLNSEAATQGLSDSLFSHLKRFDDDYVQNQTVAISACVPLRTQYRMNKWISNFSSTVFYERLLLAHPSIAERKLDFTSFSSARQETTAIAEVLKPGRPLAFLDSSPLQAEANTYETGPGVSESKTSNAEARVVRDIVAELLKRGITPKDIGIIAPFRAQVATIRRHLFSSDPTSGWEALPTSSLLSVDTVDRFQGGERMVIIMSFATSQEPPAGSQRRDFLTNPHRLNVALTRAQRKLILVGCVPALEPLPLFSRLITYCRSMKAIFPAATPTLTPTS